LNDIEKLNGRWIQVYSNEDGIDNPEEEKGLGSIADFNNGEFFVYSKNGNLLLEGIYKINTRKNPQEIDWFDSSGPDKGKLLPAIYDLSQEYFIFCAANEDMKRPASFEPKNGHTIRKFQRLSSDA